MKDSSRSSSASLDNARLTRLSDAFAKTIFLRDMRSRIRLGAFNDERLKSREDIRILKRKIPVSQVGEFHCPWIYSGSKLVTFDDALFEEGARAMQVADQVLIDLDPERKGRIDAYQQKDIALWPVPVGFDEATQKYLILDSNHSLVSRYRKYLAGEIEDVDIPIIVIAGKNIEDTIGDFTIVNRV